MLPVVRERPRLAHRAVGAARSARPVQSGQSGQSVGRPGVPQLPCRGVTDERRGTIDFVTYINDGQGFAVRDDSTLKKITDFAQLCGLNVATGAGTTFEVTLEDNKHVCADPGKKPYSVKTYTEPGAIWPSLQQGRSDVVMSTINGLRYAVQQQEA
ncbi:hypothetical protein GCM10010349_61530 [Streptomyces flavofungini]|nr:hypothetical protein GCM10010349_61530 [Streptomyces flavofungini]